MESHPEKKKWKQRPLTNAVSLLSSIPEVGKFRIYVWPVIPLMAGKDLESG